MTSSMFDKLRRSASAAAVSMLLTCGSTRKVRVAVLVWPRDTCCSWLNLLVECRATAFCSQITRKCQRAQPRANGLFYTLLNVFYGLSGDALALSVGIVASMKPQIDLAKPTAFCVAVFDRLLLVFRPGRVTHNPTRACKRGAARIGLWITRQCADSAFWIGCRLSAAVKRFCGFSEASIHADRIASPWNYLVIFHYQPRGNEHD